MQNSNITNTLSIPNGMPSVSKFEFNDAEPVLESDKLRCLSSNENNVKMSH